MTLLSDPCSFAVGLELCYAVLPTLKCHYDVSLLILTPLLSHFSIGPQAASSLSTASKSRKSARQGNGQAADQLLSHPVSLCYFFEHFLEGAFRLHYFRSQLHLPHAIVIRLHTKGTGGFLVARVVHLAQSHGCCLIRATRGSLSCGSYLLAPLIGKENYGTPN